MFDPSLTFDDLEWIKAQWPGKLVVKGIQTLEDARAVVDRGVDGLVLSNHGGRQLDRAPVPFHLLPVVARELGKHTEILVDTGIMSGADIVAAIALGARCTLVGRAYLYGLMAGGEAGVAPRDRHPWQRDSADHGAARRDLPGRAVARARDAVAAVGTRRSVTGDQQRRRRRIVWDTGPISGSLRSSRGRIIFCWEETPAEFAALVTGWWAQAPRVEVPSTLA